MFHRLEERESWNMEVKAMLKLAMILSLFGTMTRFSPKAKHNLCSIVPKNEGLGTYADYNASP
jgi:hypothetical protein